MRCVGAAVLYRLDVDRSGCLLACSDASTLFFAGSRLCVFFMDTCVFYGNGQQLQHLACRRPPVAVVASLALARFPQLLRSFLVQGPSLLEVDAAATPACVA